MLFSQPLYCMKKNGKAKSVNAFRVLSSRLASCIVLLFDVTITGRLTADGTPVAEAFVTLYNADDIIELVPVATMSTDAAGNYQFTLTDTVPGHHTYVVHSPGTAAYEPSVSEEVSVTYVTIPTTITAIAAPRQQVVGRDVTITGRLTAEGSGLAALPVTLYKNGPTEKVPVATATTDAAGNYQFTLTDTAAATHVYMACAGATAPTALRRVRICS